MDNKLKEIKEYKDNKLSEIKNLRDKQLKLEKELNRYLNDELKEIKKITGVDIKDSSRQCKFDKCSLFYCTDPCFRCIYTMCEQCDYGYKTMVEKLIKKYSIEELNEIKERCPYALIAYIKEM